MGSMMPKTCFTVTFEYSEGIATDIIDSNILHFKGIRKGSERPSYITVECNMPEGWDIPGHVEEGISRAKNVLSVHTTTNGRLILKPLWFHKEIYAKH